MSVDILIKLSVIQLQSMKNMHIIYKHIMCYGPHKLANQVKFIYTQTVIVSPNVFLTMLFIIFLFYPTV